MAWTTKYQALFTKAIVRQLVAFVQRDQRDALDFVGGAGQLPSFVSYQIAPTVIQQSPTVMIMPMHTVFDQESQDTRHGFHRFMCIIAVSHQDVQVLAEKSQDYLRALDAIFSTLPLSDFYVSQTLTLAMLGGASPTTVLQAGSVKEMFVLSHNYDDIRKSNKFGFVQTATLELLIETEEI